MSRGNYTKAIFAGIGTGICLMSLIAAVDKDTWPWKAGGAGIGLGLVTFSIVQEIEERRTYWLLYQSDNKRMKMLCGDEKIDPKVKSDIEKKLEHNLEHNLDEESALLNGGSMIGNGSKKSMNDKLDKIIELLEDFRKTIVENSAK